MRICKSRFYKFCLILALCSVLIAHSFLYFNVYQSFVSIPHDQYHRHTQWNNVSIFKQRLSYLTIGDIQYDHDGNEAFWSIPLVNISYKSFTECYANKWMLFYGDSRLRYSYADWIKLANNSILSDPYYPRNTNCPYIDNHNECSVWF